MKFKQLFIPAIAVALAFQPLSEAAAAGMEKYDYSVPVDPWPETFGAHRAVINVKKAADVVELDYDWRRPDRNVDRHRFIIVNAATGDTVPNISRLEVDNDKCNILFGPVTAPGDYYFYYLPHRLNSGHGGSDGEYLKPEDEPSAQWLALTRQKRKFEKAKVRGVEARSAFDSFYPMEVPATADELDAYVRKNRRDIYLFAEDRTQPVRMKSRVPLKWLSVPPAEAFSGQCAPNEYYTFQIAAWHPSKDLAGLSYRATPLTSGRDTIPASALTCFNLEGVNSQGSSFVKTIDVAAGRVQPLWFGVDVSPDQKAGIYKGKITVTTADGVSASVPVSIQVAGTPIADRGDSRPELLSRLRWLNSTLGISDEPIKPYSPVEYSGGVITTTGRTLTPGKAGGLPVSVTAGGHELLADGIRLVVSKDGRELSFPLSSPRVVEKTPGHIVLNYTGKEDGINLDVEANMEFDGRITYRCRLSSPVDVSLDDVRLDIPVVTAASPYFMGLGLPGQLTPRNYTGKWDTPETTVNNYGISVPTSKKSNWLWPFDSFWIGGVDAGIHCEFLGDGYSGPLLNLYRPAYPDAWNNGGRGGFRIERDDSTTLVTAYSGSRVLPADSVISFDFAMLTTPVKPINYRSQFTDRYYHNGSKPTPDEADVAAGVKIINVHHANELNPFINYPFLSVDEMKDFTRTWHDRGCKVKLYYTLRELTTALPELWAIRSLGEEILLGGRGGGYSWLQEHMVDDYTPQWYSYLGGENNHGIMADAAVLTSESGSRWYNYYVEGLAWLVRNLDIDGLYLDDVSFGRDMLKRMRRAMDSVKPGCILDLHSNTGFSRGPAIQYAEFFPYIDKVWFGESFLYDSMDPANWIVESSGIPFGLMGDMLHRGGNPWLGMQYGMTVRYPWYTEGVSCDPRAVWRVWDDFNIADSRMIGFWEKDVPVTTTDNDVKVTVYSRPGHALLSIGNYTDSVRAVGLDIDWDALGIDGSTARLTAPAIDHFQNARQWSPGDTISVEPRKGYLIYLDSEK